MKICTSCGEPLSVDEREGCPDPLLCRSVKNALLEMEGREMDDRELVEEVIYGDC